MAHKIYAQFGCAWFCVIILSGANDAWVLFTQMLQGCLGYSVVMLKDMGKTNRNLSRVVGDHRLKLFRADQDDDVIGIPHQAHNTGPINKLLLF